MMTDAVYLDLQQALILPYERERTVTGQEEKSAGEITG